MDNQSLVSTLMDIVKRLDRIEKLLSKSTEGYMMVETEASQPAIKYTPSKPIIGYFNDSEDSDSDIPNDDTYESDTDDNSFQSGKRYLLTPNQVQRINKKMIELTD